jgi:uncharacterized protein YndB with AHSA1/START domain
MPPKNESNEIKLTRVYDAPVKLVWEAWTDPKQTAKWWGPRGFTLTTHSKDLRVGGNWNYTMHGPDGTDYPNITTYHEVEKYSRLVYDHGASEGKPPLFHVTVTFSENKGKTTMNMTMALATPEAARETRKFIKQAGGNATWDRLAEYLGEEISQQDIFVINRTFEAPIKTVFEMWTNPHELSKWLPPTGFKMEFIRPEIKVGGSSFYSMSDGKTTMFGRSNYLEITPYNRVVYTQLFCDKDEKISRHPMAPMWPETMLVTLTLNEESADETRVTITSSVYGEANAAEREMFHNAKGGMTMGWSGSFDKLDEQLSQK